MAFTKRSCSLRHLEILSGVAGLWWGVWGVAGSVCPLSSSYSEESFGELLSP